MRLCPHGAVSPAGGLFLIVSVLIWVMEVRAVPPLHTNLAAEGSPATLSHLRRIAGQEAATAKKGSSLSEEEFEENNDAAADESTDKSDYLPPTTKRPPAALTTVTSATARKQKLATPKRTATAAPDSSADVTSEDTSGPTMYQQKQGANQPEQTNTGRTTSGSLSQVGSRKGGANRSSSATKTARGAQSHKPSSTEEEEVASSSTADLSAAQGKKVTKGDSKTVGKSSNQCRIDYSMQVQKVAALVKSLFAVRIQTAIPLRSSQGGRDVPLASAIQISVDCVTLTIHGTTSQRIINERAATLTCTTGSWDVENSVTSVTAGSLLASLWDNTETADNVGTCDGGEDAGLALMVDGLYISLQGVTAAAKVVDYSDQLLLTNAPGTCKATSLRIPIYGLDVLSLAPPDGPSSAMSFSVSARKRHDCQNGSSEAQSGSVLIIIRNLDDASCDSSSFMSSESESSSEVSDKTSSSSETSRENSSGIELASKKRPSNSRSQTQEASRKDTAPSTGGRVVAATTASSAQNEEEEGTEEGKVQASTAKSVSVATGNADQQTTVRSTSIQQTTARRASSVSKRPSSTNAADASEEDEGADESVKISAVTTAKKLTTPARTESVNKTSSSGKASFNDDEEEEDEDGAGASKISAGETMTTNNGTTVTSGRGASLNATSSSRPSVVISGNDSTTSVSSNGTSQDQSVSVPQIPQGPQLPGAGGIDSFGGSPMDSAAGYGAPPAASNSYGPSPAPSYRGGDSQGAGSSGSRSNGGSYGGGSDSGGYGGGSAYGSASTGRGGGGLGLAGPIGLPGILSPFG
ncbi:hypothetical protein RvY_18891-2 [Ramazzottius varieornatus]|nr:hypothetical protein RvY_18891-2 [Ramazzottius varieornatus]